MLEQTRRKYWQEVWNRAAAETVVDDDGAGFGMFFYYAVCAIASSGDISPDVDVISTDDAGKP